jgi:CMP-N,N'-diacetyllegionaminic acid synthase
VKILALITARGGSKRLPGKNIRPLAGRPLIEWSVDAVRGIADICAILVSTDDAAIADVARRGGALVPWLRPAALSTDTATSVDACLHALQWYETEYSGVDGLLLLQPTSPFRRRETVLDGLALFASHGRRPVIGVSPAPSHPLRCFTIDNGALRPYVDGGGRHVKSEALPPAYVVNGAFYLIAPADLRARGSFSGADIVPLVMDRPEEALDIDTAWDWTLAEAVAASVAGRA